MRGLLLHLRLALLYSAQVLKTRLHYRGDFLLGCLASLLSQAAGLAVVAVVFENTPALGGWTRAEVFFIYGFALTAQAIFESVADGFYWFSDRYVGRGELDRVLLRPLDPLFQVLLENFDLEFIPDLILGAAILAAAAGSLETPLGPADLFLLIPMLLGAVLVLLGLFLALTSVSFRIEDRVGILPPVYNLMAFGRYPLTIYHWSMQLLLSTVLPFAFVAFFPCTGFLGREEFSAAFWGTPPAGVLAFGLGYLAWRAGLRRYQSAGS